MYRGLAAILEFIRLRDELVAMKLDRLCSTRDVLNLVHEFEQTRPGCGCWSLSSARATPVVMALGTVAELERKFILAPARRHRGGRGQGRHL